MNTNHTKQVPDDVAKLIYGNIEELRIYLRDVTDVDLVERALKACRTKHEGKTMIKILERHLKKLRKPNASN